MPSPQPAGLSLAIALMLMANMPELQAPTPTVRPALKEEKANASK